MTGEMSHSETLSNLVYHFHYEIPVETVKKTTQRINFVRKWYSPNLLFPEGNSDPIFGQVFFSVIFKLNSTGF